MSLQRAKTCIVKIKNPKNSRCANREIPSPISTVNKERPQANIDFYDIYDFHEIYDFYEIRVSP